MSIDEFYLKNALPPIPYDDIKCSNFGKRILFVNIASSYKDGMTDAEIQSVACGRWKLNDKNARDIKYLFAMNKSIVRGIYKITGVHQGFDITSLPNRELEKDYIQRIESCLEGRIEDFVSSESAQDLYREYIEKSVSDPAEKEKKMSNLTESFEQWINLKYFDCVSIQEGTEKQLTSFIGRRLEGKVGGAFFGRRSIIRYNY